MDKRSISLLFLFPTLASGVAFANAEVERAKEPAPRIINGDVVDKDAWPYMTALAYPNSSAFDGQFCGATFIGNKYVLTASHCVDQSNRADLEAIVGIHDLENEIDGQRVTVKQIYMHEKYNPFTTANDVAIIELNRSLNTKAATLAEAELFDMLAEGEELTVTGWGNQEQDSFAQPIYPNLLFGVSIPLVSNYTCKKAGGGYAAIGDDAFCAGLPEGGKDSCQGDSGGPMYVNDGGVFKQLGVVSWGEGCAEAGKYGVYANVSHFAKWIKAKTAGISYTQTHNLGFTEKGDFTHTFNIENTTNQELALSNIELTNGATIVDDGCTESLAIGASCNVEVAYSVTKTGYGDVKLTADTNHPENESIEMKAKYTALEVASSALHDTVNIPNAKVLVNENPWEIYGENGLTSKTIGDNEWSIMAITTLPKGDFKFDVGVSSEDGYDKLEIRVNGSKFDSITGDVEYKDIVVNLPLESNNIAFIYSKDETDEGYVGDDMGWIKNIEFTSTGPIPWTEIDDTATPVTPPVVTVPWTEVTDTATPVTPPVVTTPWTEIDDTATPVKDTRPIVMLPGVPVDLPEPPKEPVAGKQFQVIFDMTVLAGTQSFIDYHVGDIARITIGYADTRLAKKPMEVVLTANDIKRGWVKINATVKSAGEFTLVKSLINGFTNEAIYNSHAEKITIKDTSDVSEVEVEIQKSSGGSMNMFLLFGLPLLAIFRKKKITK